MRILSVELAGAHRALFVFLVSLGLMMTAERPAAAWNSLILGGGRFEDVATLPNGDVVAAGSEVFSGQYDWLVARYDGNSGTVLWHVYLPDGIAYRIAVDANGDVFVAGKIDEDSEPRFAVAKLNGTTGAVLWAELVSTLPNGSVFSKQPPGLAVDGAGNVVATAPDAVTEGTKFRVLKLLGATGAIVWDYVEPTTNNSTAYDLAMDAAGDVVAVGSLLNGTDGSGFSAVKLSGSSGSEIWKQQVVIGDADYRFALHVTVDPSGDAIVGGVSHGPTWHVGQSVAKLTGTDGTVLWTQHIYDNSNYSPDASALFGITTNAAGRIFVAGHWADTYAVNALDPTDGSVLWRTIAFPYGMCDWNDPFPCLPAEGCNFCSIQGYAYKIATLSNGDVVTTGVLNDSYSYTPAEGSHQDTVAIRQSAADGSLIWRSRRHYHHYTPYGLGVTANDDVVVGGYDGDYSGHNNTGAFVAKLDGTDGHFFDDTTTTTVTSTTVTTVTTTTVPVPSDGVGHVQCYKAKDGRTKAAYTLDLNAGAAGFPSETGCSVKLGAKWLCTEVDKQNVSPPPPGGGPAIPPNGSSVFIRYKLKCPSQTVAPVALEDQFGGGSFSVGKAATLLVPAEGANAPASANDHFACFKTKDTRAKVPYTMDLNAPYFGFLYGVETGCTISGAASEVCVQVTEQNVVPPSPGGGPGPGPAAGAKFIAYKLKCPKTYVPASNFQDEFGGGTFYMKSPSTLFVPAE